MGRRHGFTYLKDVAAFAAQVTGERFSHAGVSMPSNGTYTRTPTMRVTNIANESLARGWVCLRTTAGALSVLDLMNLADAFMCDPEELVVSWAAEDDRHGRRVWISISVPGAAAIAAVEAAQRSPDELSATI